MHPIKTLRAASWALTLLVLTGCVGSVFRQPQVTLESVQVGGLGLRGGTLLVEVKVQNPNRFALNSNGLSYDLAIRDPEAEGDSSWISFATGTYEEPFSVKPGETSSVQIPVEFTYSGLGTAGGALLRNGTFSYRANGTVDVKTPLGGYALPFQKRGTVTLLGAR